MTDSSPSTESQASSSTESKSTKPNSGKRPVLGVIALLFVATVGGWAGYIYVTGKDGFSWKRFTLQGLKKPEFVPVTGKILFNGEPLVNGIVQLYPVDERGGKKAVAPIQKDGTFKVYTDIDGSMTEGAYVGDYKAVINAIYPLRTGQLGTTPVLPPEYYKKETTPVELTVFSDPDKNRIVWTLKGTPANPPPGAAGGKKFAGKKKGGKFDPETMIRRIMQSDKNSDGKIGRDEASDRLKRNFDAIDTNKDGFIDENELRASFRVRRGKRNPGKTTEKKRPKNDGE